MNIYIWGTGRLGKKVLQAIKRKNSCVKGCIDNNPDKWGGTFEGIGIVSFKEAANDYDLIIISVWDSQAVLYQLKLEGHTDSSKIIDFFSESSCNHPYFSEVIDEDKWRIILLERKVERLEKLVNIRFNNAGYEIIDRYRRGLYQYPQIGDTQEAVHRIINERCSLVRYGDGEFEIMAGKERAVFQRYNEELARRLTEIITSKEDRLLIAIANNYGMLDPYMEDTADGIRGYMDEKTREFHMSVLDKGRTYYDAYMFKSYFPYKNREDTWKRVELVKKIWNGRNVVLVEGDKTRAGCGNDLFDNAKSLRRILAPTKNAYDRYADVLKAVLKVEKECLILVVLGPMAEVLVFDLMKEGYQAIDIGQIDMDYQWYRAGAKGRVPIPDRYVSQLPPAEIEEMKNVQYSEQIIEWV